MSNHKEKVEKLFDDWAKVYDLSTEEGLPYLVEKDILIKTIDPKKSDKILDIGCGTGRITQQLVKYSKNVIGTDLSEEMLIIARKKLPKIAFVQAEIENLPFKDKTFDKVVSSLTFQFLPNIKRPLQEIHRVLKNGSKSYITDFVADAPMNWKDVEYKREKAFGGSVSSVSKFRTTKEYEEMALEVGLELLKIIPLKVNKLAKEILTEKSWKKIKGSWASVIFVFKRT